MNPFRSIDERLRSLSPESRACVKRLLGPVVKTNIENLTVLDCLKILESRGHDPRYGQLADALSPLVDRLIALERSASPDPAGK